jgi:hypothetical protein
VPAQGYRGYSSDPKRRKTDRDADGDAPDFVATMGLQQ